MHFALMTILRSACHFICCISMDNEESFFHTQIIETQSAVLNDWLTDWLVSSLPWVVLLQPWMDPHNHHPVPPTDRPSSKAVASISTYLPLLLLLPLLRVMVQCLPFRYRAEPTLCCTDVEYVAEWSNVGWLVYEEWYLLIAVFVGHHRRRPTTTPILDLITLNDTLHRDPPSLSIPGQIRTSC